MFATRLDIFKKILVALFLGSFVVLGTGAYCGNSSNPASNSSVSTSAVSIENMAFNPPNASISSGTTVTWTNNDSTTHQVESDGNLSNLLSGEIAPGQTYTFTFNQTGTYTYHCKIHPNMNGQIVVK